MDSLFDVSFFKANRGRLRKLIGGDAPIVITANGLVQRGADSAYEFVQDASFWYLTGIEEPDIVAVVGKNEQFLIAPHREENRETFDGVLDTAAMAKVSGITEVLDEAAGWHRLGALLKKHGKAATLAPASQYIEQYGMYANPARRRLQKRLQTAAFELELIDIRKELAQLRMIKQPVEITAIQKAIDITSETLTEILDGDRTQYAYEYQLEADISRGFRRRGATGHAFEPIVAGGPRACTLHNVANNSKLAPAELVVLDVGAEYQHYAADITRTISLQPATDRQQAVYDAVRGVQTYGFEILKPGLTMKEFETQIAERMAETLQSLGLIKDADKASVRKYYPHATSHFMGLNVHDSGDYSVPLAPGVVMTVEPGIYIPEEGIGVRIEDDVLITETGIEVLSDRLPRTLS